MDAARSAWRRLHAIRLGAKLALILLAAMLLALGVVYALVVPRLESRLVQAKLDELDVTLAAIVAELKLDTGNRIEIDLAELQDRAEGYSQFYGVRVVFLQVIDGVSLVPVVDSRTLGDDVADLRTDPWVRRAVVANRSRGTTTEDGDAYAVVALLNGGGNTVLAVTDRLDDAARGVELIRKSLIVAGAIGLGAAMLTGVIAQLRYTRRIRRLEQAAERIAGGDLVQPVPHEGEDELGELAAAMERMRAQLEQLDRARKAFIANASHELKTPLFALGGFLELMDDDEVDDPTRREFVAQMRDQVDRLTRLTGDLLDLSRLDAGQLPIAIEPVDLASCAETIVEDFRAVAEQTRHELVIAGSATAGLGDEGWVRRIGSALVENALRHTPAGTRVVVATGGAGGGAFLRVSDDGPGIPPAEVGSLFDRFYRGSGGIAHGSGLGLSIARELAVRMGGSLDVSSGTGGTVFELRLRSAPVFPRENAPAAVS